MHDTFVTALLLFCTVQIGEDEKDSVYGFCPQREQRR